MALMNFETTALPLEKFTVQKHNDGTFSLIAEESDFGPLRAGRPWLGQLYDDACDLGIGIRSHVTGRIVLFCHHETHHNGEDTLSTEYRPIENGSRVNRVIIFND